jgi:cytochrome c553
MNIRAITVLPLVLLSVSAQANEADIQAGALKSVSCAACHGQKGITTIPMYPNLAGQKPIYFENQMKAFRNGNRPNPIMGNLAQPLTDEDIRQLAAYYASLSGQ